MPTLPGHDDDESQGVSLGGDSSMTSVALTLPPSPPLPPSSFSLVNGVNQPRSTLNGDTSDTMTTKQAERNSGHATDTGRASDSAAALLTNLDLASLPLSPLPHHLQPYLSSTRSRLSDQEKRQLFTDVYLHAASAGNSDTLEYLVHVPTDATSPTNDTLHRAQDAELSDDPPTARLNGQRPADLVECDTISGMVRSRSTLPDNCPRKWVDLEARDADGNTALGLSAALGHAEGVRVLVEAGVDIMGRDRAGWTPLHWAVQNADLPIAAYLLNHGASPLASSSKGLTPRDLVKRGKEGAAMRDVLRSAHEAALERERVRRDAAAAAAAAGSGAVERGEAHDEDDGQGLRRIDRPQLNDGSHTEDENEAEREPGERPRPESRNSWASSSVATSTARPPRWADDVGKVEEERQASEMMRKRELALESARTLEIDLGTLGLGVRGSPETNGMPADDEQDEEGIQNPFIWDRCEPDQMLVFSLNDLGVLFDVVITTMKPVRQRSLRVIPANVIFLCARYAHYFCSPELLEELIVGAMERIEAVIHHQPDNMANCAFWLSNCLLLLFYLRKEPNLNEATSEMQVHLCDLINEIFVFIIRDAERRIDRVLEPALLEHESLPGFEDVDFEGEWSSNRFVKKLTGGRSKKASTARTTSVSSLFSSVSSSASEAGNLEHGTGEVVNSSGTVVEASPQSVTSLLSSMLFVLQLYEIPPSIIVQAFSQLMYWIACEIFNRLLTQRKYLCRTRAMQIRLNASSLEEWARQNRLPNKMVTVHFTPLNQLLQWLQCLSSEQTIDGLIGTTQALRSLNPLQLRRAVRDYRYEVEEQHISDDCSQYLVQIQSQWERLRLQRTVEGLGSAPGAAPSPRRATLADESGAMAHGSPYPTAAAAAMGRTASAEEAEAETIEAQGKVQRMIDQVFAEPGSFGNYTPPGDSPPSSMGELLNSRYMLPFAVPSSAALLVHAGSVPDAFGPFSASASYAPSAAASSAAGPRSLRHSLSTLSLTSSSNLSSARGSGSRAGGPKSSVDELDQDDTFSDDDEGQQDESEAEVDWGDQQVVPILPDDFFAVLDAARAKVAAAAAAVTARNIPSIRAESAGDYGGNLSTLPTTHSLPAATTTTTTTAFPIRQGLGFGEDVDVDADVGTPLALAAGEHVEPYAWTTTSSTADEEEEEEEDGRRAVTRRGQGVRSGEEEEEEDGSSTAEDSVSGTDEDDEDDESGEVEATPRPRDGFQMS